MVTYRIGVGAVCCVAILASAAVAHADVITSITMMTGSETFLEGTQISGQMTWSTDEDLVLRAGDEVSFLSITTDSLDSLASPLFAENVMLTGWSDGSISVPIYCSVFPQFRTIGMSMQPPFLHLQSGGFVLSNDCVISAGVFATLDWTLTGIDVDGLPDDDSFSMTAQLIILRDIENIYTLTVVDARDKKLFNPEPVPEPTTACLLIMGAIGLIRRRVL